MIPIVGPQSSLLRLSKNVMLLDDCCCRCRASMDTRFRTRSTSAATRSNTAGRRKLRNNNNNKNEWMKRHVKDPFVRRAKQEGQVSRSFYKLQQMNDKHKLFSRNNDSRKTVVELGAAPGGWTSYCLQHLSGGSVLVAIDLLPLDPRVVKQLAEYEQSSTCESHVIQGDFMSVAVQEELNLILRARRHADHGGVDLVLSDMATACFTGDTQTDALRTMALCEGALQVSIGQQGLLKQGGSFVGKYFSCADEVELKQYARQYFDKVKTVKPQASRKESAERYLVATGYSYQ